MGVSELKRALTFVAAQLPKPQTKKEMEKEKRVAEPDAIYKARLDTIKAAHDYYGINDDEGPMPKVEDKVEKRATHYRSKLSLRTAPQRNGPLKTDAYNT